VSRGGDRHKRQECLGQFVQAERLCEDVSRPAAKQVIDLVRPSTAGHKARDEPTVQPAERVQRVGSIHSGHTDVEQDDRDRRRILPEVGRGRIRIRSHPHPEPVPFQTRPEQDPHRFLIIDYEDSRMLRGTRYRAVRGRRNAARGRAK
jgi:hypothetical protein